MEQERLRQEKLEKQRIEREKRLAARAAKKAAREAKKAAKIHSSEQGLDTESITTIDSEEEIFEPQDDPGLQPPELFSDDEKQGQSSKSDSSSESDLNSLQDDSSDSGSSSEDDFAIDLNDLQKQNVQGSLNYITQRVGQITAKLQHQT